MTFNLPSAEGRSRKGDSLLGVLALKPLKRESGNRMQADACLSSKNLLSGETREKNARGWRLPWKLRSKYYGNIREHFEWAKLKLRLLIIFHLTLFRLYRKVAKLMQGVPLPGFGAGALTRELKDWRNGRHRKAERDSLGSPMNKLQNPGGTVGLLHTVEQGGRFIARGRVYGIDWTRRQV